LRQILTIINFLFFEFKQKREIIQKKVKKKELSSRQPLILGIANNEVFVFSQLEHEISLFCVSQVFLVFLLCLLRKIIKYFHIEE